MGPVESGTMAERVNSALRMSVGKFRWTNGKAAVRNSGLRQDLVTRIEQIIAGQRSAQVDVSLTTRNEIKPGVQDVS